MTSVFIHNFGCRVNQAEAFDWSDRLNELGISVKKDWRKSDLVIVNSCALTSRAEADVRQFVRRLYREAPETRLIITGCLAEKNGQDFKNFPNVSLVIPNSAKESLVEELIRLVGPGYQKIEKKPYRSRALVKIQDGCDAHCTFCIIPSLRGKSRSVPEEQVVEQVKRAIGQGYNEVVLAGINLCAYGQDLSPESSLLKLLGSLNQIPELKLIRLSSLDPRLLSSELLDFLVSEEKICPHFHLSLQHASPEVLKKMGRKSTPEEYLQIMNFLRAGRPEAGLGADIMVGFPGEGEADFEFLKKSLVSSPLTYFHVFCFSPREGTPAAHWPQVDEKIKKRRSEELRWLSREKNLAFKQNFLGKILPAIVIKKKGVQVEALTSNYFKVIVDKAAGIAQRQVVKVRVSEVNPYSVKGEVV
jgi:threonylcarbamoyladenosine tRNA methylthiotransferase MtaB